MSVCKNDDVLQVNLFDSNIAHAVSYDDSLEKGRIEPGLKYMRDYDPQRVSIFTDNMLSQVGNKPGSINVAWIMEPINFAPTSYDYLSRNYKKFDLILTHNLDVIDAHASEVECRYITADGIFLDTPALDRANHSKSRLCSHIFSNKKSLPGHRLRHEIAAMLPNSFDMFGSGTGKWLEKKSDALRDYYFSTSIENSRSRGYFTEKIMDCFATRTVPIYWGDDYVWEHFNKDGAIRFDTLEQLKDIINSINKEMYDEMLPAIEQNHEICIKSCYSVDRQVKQHIQEFIKSR